MGSFLNKKNTTRSTSRDLITSLALNIISNVVLYIGHLIIARRLLRDDYATFVVIVSFVSLSALFADLGLMGLFIRKFAEAEALAKAGKKDLRGELLGSILALKVILAILVSLVVLVILPFLGYPLETRHLVMIMLVTFFLSSRIVVVRSVGEAFLRAANKYHVVALLIVIDAITFTGLLFFSSDKILDMEAVVWIYSFCHLPGFVILTLIITKDIKSAGYRLHVNFNEIRLIVRESLPFILSTAFLTIHTQADLLLLDKMSSSNEVSAFGAGLRVLSAIIFLPVVFSAVIGPLVTKATVSMDFERVRSILDRSLRFLLSGSLLVAIILSVSSAEVMNLLFGSSKYSDAAPLVIIFGWAFIPMCLGAFVTDIANAEGKFWIPAIYTFIIMIISILGDILLIPHYGAYGVAIAKLTSLCIGCIALILAMNKLEVFNLRNVSVSILKLSFVALLSLAVIYLLSLWQLEPLFSLIIVLLTFFVSTVFICKIISLSEIRLFIPSFFSRVT